MGDIKTLKELLLANDLDHFKELLKGFNSDNLNQKECDGLTIMQTAVIQNQKQFVDALLDFNVDANYGAGRKKPVLLAAEYGYSKILESFMDRKRDVEFNVCTEKNGTLSGQENVLHLGK